MELCFYNAIQSQYYFLYPDINIYTHKFCQVLWKKDTSHWIYYYKLCKVYND